MDVASGWQVAASIRFASNDAERVFRNALTVEAGQQQPLAIAPKNLVDAPDLPFPLPAKTSYPLVTGEAAAVQARQVAQAAWQPDARVRNEWSETLLDYLARDGERSDVTGAPLFPMDVLGIYGNIIITARAVLSAERKRELLSDAVRSLEEGAALPTGRAMLSSVQRSRYPLVIEINLAERNAYEPGERDAATVGANFDRVYWDPEVAGADAATQALLPPWLLLFHEIGHALVVEDARADSIAAMTPQERELFPLGNIYVLDEPAARSEGDLIDERGSRGANGIRDDEDVVLLKFEGPLAREAGLVPRPSYSAVDSSELYRAPDPIRIE